MENNNKFDLAIVSDQLNDRFRSAKAYYEKHNDPFGLNVDKFAAAFKLLMPLYEHYFRVRVFGVEHIQNLQRHEMFISNHTGQIPIDGLLLGMATFMHGGPHPLILRGMGERFLMGLPFLGQFAREVGVILGDRKNCEICIERGESVLTFPEGVRGISKSTPDYYRMQKFSLGFLRLALKYRTSLRPVVVVGAEEMYPMVWQAPKVAKLFGFPSFPISPFFPWFGPIGMIPMPAPIDIYFLPKVELPADLDHSAPDEDLSPFVKSLHKLMQAQIDQGLESKRPTIPLSNILKNQELKSHLAQLWDEGKKLIFSKKEL
jgi:1-acyl-sn-glycerol-3-phosphate acyltransferase